MSSVSLNVQPAALTVSPGTVGVARLSLHNEGSDVVQLKLRAQGIDPSWVQLEPSQMGLFPGDQSSATVRVIVPGGTPPATFRATLVAVNQAGQSEASTAALAITVGDAASQKVEPTRASAPAAAAISSPTLRSGPPAGRPAGTPLQVVSPGAGQLAVTADRSSISLVPGSMEVVQLTLKNNGGSPLPVEISVQGPPSQWLALSTSSAQLAPAQTAIATLSLTAPAEAPTGSYPLAVDVQSRDEPAVRVRLEFVFEIAEPGKLLLEISPAQAEGQASAEFQVRVSHSGDAPLDVRFSASDTESGCSYTFDPPTLRVAPQEAATSRLTVTARQSMTGADSRTYPFTVSAVTAQGVTDVSQAAGRFVQVQVPPLQLVVNPPRQTGPTSVTFNVQLVNPTQVQAIVRLTATDPNGACRYQFAPASVTVPAKSTRATTLTVTPVERHSDPTDILHTITVHAQPTQGLVSAVEASTTFLQTALPRPIPTLSPSSQSAAGAANFALQIANPRPAPMSVEITPVGGDGMSEINIAPDRATIPAQGRLTARVQVRPTSALLPGEQRRTCAFAVQVRSRDLDEPVELKGSLIQVPGAPIGRWLGIAGAALLALMLCAGLLWLAPTVSNSLGSSISGGAATLSSQLSPVTAVPLPTGVPTPTAVPTKVVEAPTATPNAALTQAAEKAAAQQAAAKQTSDADKAAAQKTSNAEKAAGQQTKQADQKTATAEAKMTQDARSSQYNGIWVNDDSTTTGITRLMISSSGSSISVHAFFKCSPSDCDWGTQTKTFNKEPFVVTFNTSGQGTHQLTLTQENGKLKVADVASGGGARLYTYHSALFLPPGGIPRLTLVPPVISK